ncbi:EAL domain-containing protein [Sulfurimonas lithotrophica]|uniref:EAL domain-containing protein n=2 Tax=Sulfurimonas lithotrophica TaxID=2590022 RepID=A0A5P8P022_9BACT|nr:EAL domain-containing protein [Sulfurimonas lithotrophica]
MFSLMTKLFFAGVFISVVPLFIYQYISFEQSSKTLQLTYAKELKHKTELTTLLINQAISHRSSDLNIIAGGVGELLSLKNYKTIEKQFNNLALNKNDVNSLTLLDKEARVLIASDKSRKNISSEVRNILTTYKSSAINEVYLSELVTNNDEAYIYMIKKMIDYDYFLVIEINIKNIDLLLSNFDDEVNGDKAIYIIDKNNNIIISSDKTKKIMASFTDIDKLNSQNELDDRIFHFKDFENEDVIASYDEISKFGFSEALGWKIIASIPISVINKDVSKSLAINKKVSILIVIITFLILTLLSRNIVKSIQKVVDVANKISSGDYSARVEDKNTTTEFNTLLIALNSMADKIQNRTNKLEEQKLLLENLAHYDTLTQIPNRVLFKDRIEQAIAKAKRHKNKFALFYIDLDEFKHINDSFGHDMGDEILKVIVLRINTVLRKEDTFARLGGDEFTIILEELQDINSITVIADKIIDTIKKPIDINGNVFKVSTSIGISIYPKDATDKSNLIKYSDIAMYKAKSMGKDNYQFYSEDMSNYSYNRIKMKQSLDFALENNEFEVYYQPQINAKTNELSGMEALIRWNHPEDGYIAPLDFLPLAEEIGMIIEIDQWVMKTAMKQMLIWNEQGYNPVILSLNLSIKHLQHENFVSMLKSNLEETGCKPEWIELEVTESHIMSNYEESIAKLKEINKLGIRISMDDFGTGYSSLSHLKLLPIDKLKIDKSFVNDIPEDEEDVAIIKAIIALCKSLDLTVLAEGVETDKQSGFLVENGCSYIQGYLYGKPQSNKDFERNFLKS